MDKNYISETQGKGFASRISAMFCLVTAISLIVCVLYGCQAGSGAAQTEIKSSDGGVADVEEVTLGEWTPDTDCAACHAGQQESMSNSACQASSHAASQCIDCHQQEQELKTVHEGVSSTDRVSKRLRSTTIESDVCLSCHVQTEIAGATASSTALIDSEGTAVNPHDLPSEGTHRETACADCHDLHTENADIAEDAKAYCISCHHADVFECNTCHEEH